jgi:hypothetical protein
MIKGRLYYKSVYKVLGPIDWKKIIDVVLSQKDSHVEPNRARICKRLRNPGIDSQPGGPLRQLSLTYRPARIHRLQNRFHGIDSWAP